MNDASLAAHAKTPCVARFAEYVGRDSDQSMLTYQAW
jgi:hypothetical protein